MQCASAAHKCVSQSNKRHNYSIIQTFCIRIICRFSFLFILFYFFNKIFEQFLPVLGTVLATEIIRSFSISVTGAESLAPIAINLCMLFSLLKLFLKQTLLRLLYSVQMPRFLSCSNWMKKQKLMHSKKYRSASWFQGVGFFAMVSHCRCRTEK